MFKKKVDQNLVVAVLFMVVFLALAVHTVQPREKPDPCLKKRGCALRPAHFSMGLKELMMA